MPDGAIQISRDELVLGSLPESEALELLRLGFFRPDDWFWRAGMRGRRSMSELVSAVAAAPGPAAEPAAPGPRSAASWLGRARESVTGVAGVVASSASGVAGRLRSLVTETPAMVTQATNAVLEGYLPQIRAALEKAGNSRAIQAVKGGVRDDELMRKSFGAVYDCLPRPVCRFVNEERFTTFCLTHRNRLLGSGDPGAENGDQAVPSS